MDAKPSPADPRQTKEFCWRQVGPFRMIVAPARYDGSACVVIASPSGVYALVHRTHAITSKERDDEINAWLLSKGYTPIW